MKKLLFALVAVMLTGGNLGDTISCKDEYGNNVDW